MQIILDEKLYVLCPEFETLCSIEKELGSGLVTLARKLAEENITLEELAVILTRCMQPCVELELVKGVLLRNGIAQAIEAVAIMFAEVFGGK